MGGHTQVYVLLQDELDSVDTSVVISSCSLAEARHLLDHFLKASIDKVSPRSHHGADALVLFFVAKPTVKLNTNI